MGFRDLRASLAQFNLIPEDPETERQARIERFVEESVRLSGVDDDCDLSSPFADANEEWTVVYDKFRVY